MLTHVLCNYVASLVPNSLQSPQTVATRLLPPSMGIHRQNTGESCTSSSGSCIGDELSLLHPPALVGGFFSWCTWKPAHNRLLRNLYLFNNVLNKEKYDLLRLGIFRREEVVEVFGVLTSTSS